MLFKKMLRTFSLYKAQFISMIIMITLGIAMVLGFNAEWYSIDKSTTNAYAKSGFADYRIMSENGTLSDADSVYNKIKNINGVDYATKYLSVNMTVKDTKKVIALSVSSNMNVSGIELISGEQFDDSLKDAIWISDQYASKNNIKVGDEICLTYKNIELKGHIKGLIKASEYLICTPDEKQLMPDFTTYGFAYTTTNTIKNIFGKEIYSQINIKSDLPKNVLSEKIKDSVGETMIILSKDETTSYCEAQGEIEEGKTMGSMLPVIFLVIALLTMVTTMHRIVTREKKQIGTLKSLGYKDSRIIRHYTFYATFIGIVSGILGIPLGYAVCYYIMNPNGMMGTYMDMSKWIIAIPTFSWMIIAGIIILLTLIGYLSVKSMLKGTAADALRPYSAPQARSLLLEKTFIWDKLKFGTRWNLRDSIRHFARTLMSMLGIVGCSIIIIACLGMYDTMDVFIDEFYVTGASYNNVINLDSESITNDKSKELSDKYNGDRLANISIEYKGDSKLVQVYDINSDLIKFIDRNNNSYLKLANDGVFICGRMADDNNLKAGDKITFSPYGSSDTYTVKVKGVIRELTESMVMSDTYADKIGLSYTYDSILTKSKDIEKSELITSIQSKSSIMDSYDSFMTIMNAMIYLLVLVGMVLATVVLYNLGTMSYTERYREMATLKVVGFKDKQIRKILIGQNIWLTVIGLIIGLPVGRKLLDVLCDSLATEYELRTRVTLPSYIITIILVMGVSLIVGLLISHKSKKIDMVEALKCED